MELEFQLSAPAMFGILAAFFVVMMVLSTLIARRSERADTWVVSNRKVGFGLSAASVMATAIWAPSFYGAAISGYEYGISGPLHYGLWGALIYVVLGAYGKRIRSLSPKGHTLTELMYARHGAGAHLSTGVVAILHSVVSLMLNLTAAGALISILSPVPFDVGVVITAIIVVAYTFWSGFRASVVTDFVQISAVGLITVVVIPIVLFTIGGPGELASRVDQLGPERADFFSTEAILNQGAPMFVAILSWAFANQPLMQRIFAVRSDKVNSSLVLGGVGYGSIVVGLGMLGMMAAIIGVQPANDDPNNIVPQMATAFLPVVLVIAFAFLVIAALASTCDSDLSGLAALMMTDVYRRYIARAEVSNKTMLWFGRVAMVGAAVLAAVLATLQASILDALLTGASLYGAIVFPVIASMYWRRVSNVAFTAGVLTSMLCCVLINLEFMPIPVGAVHSYVFEVIAIVGAGVVVGLLAYPYFGRTVALVGGGITSVACLPLLGFLSGYTLLTGALVTYGVSAIVTTGLTMFSTKECDFDEVRRKVPELFTGEQQASQAESKEPA